MSIVHGATLVLPIQDLFQLLWPWFRKWGQGHAAFDQIARAVVHQNPGYLHVHLLFFRGTKYDRPSYMAGDYIKPLSMLMFLLSSFYLVLGLISSFKDFGPGRCLLGGWPSDLARKCCSQYLFAMRRTKTWLENWNKNDLKTGTKMTWKLILGVENKKMSSWLLGHEFFWKLWELPWVGKQLRLQWRCGHHLASMLMFGGRTRQPPKLRNRTKWAHHLYNFQMGFLGGEKFLQPKFEDPKCWNLKKNIVTKRKKTATPCSFHPAFSIDFHPSPWSGRLQLGASMHLLLIGWWLHGSEMSGNLEKFQPTTTRSGGMDDRKGP